MEEGGIPAESLPKKRITAFGDHSLLPKLKLSPIQFNHTHTARNCKKTTKSKSTEQTGAREKNSIFLDSLAWCLLSLPVNLNQKRVLVLVSPPHKHTHTHTRQLIRKRLFFWFGQICSLFQASIVVRKNYFIKRSTQNHFHFHFHHHHHHQQTNNWLFKMALSLSIRSKWRFHHTTVGNHLSKNFQKPEVSSQMEIKFSSVFVQ